MDPLVLTIPPEAVAAAPYADGILPGGAACRMVGMEKVEWHY